MKIKYSLNKKDFFLFYFSQIFLKKPSLTDSIYKFADIFNIDKKEIRSIELSNERKKSLFKNKNLKEFKDYYFLFDYYKKLDKKKIKILLSNLEKYLDNFKLSLTELFGESKDLENIKIAFVQPGIENLKTELNAFTGKFLENKIYLAFDDNFSLENTISIDYYTKVLLHEIGHIFINNNISFQKILREEWGDKYKNINPNSYRFEIEELLVSSLIFPTKDFGFLFKNLNLQENQKEKQISLENNKYRKITFQFLEDLENSKLENKLEIFLPKYLENLEKEGLFTNF